MAICEKCIKQSVCKLCDGSEIMGCIEFVGKGSNVLTADQDEVKLLVRISNRFYAKVLDEFYTHADLIDGMNAIRDGQILPDGCEILTKEAYVDLCVRASKGQEPTTKSETLVSLDVYNQVAKERNIAIQQLHELGYEFGQKIEPTTKNDLGVDAVSRQAVLELIADYNLSMGQVVRGIHALPSVTPQEPRWIPCNEKKPDKGGEYLLWGKIDESEEENYCFIGDYHEFDEVFGTEISNYDPKTLGFIDTEIEEYYSVVAWMPLPQQYSEVEKCQEKKQ